jgi:hypothetical protein
MSLGDAPREAFGYAAEQLQDCVALFVRQIKGIFSISFPECVVLATEFRAHSVV